MSEAIATPPQAPAATPAPAAPPTPTPSPAPVEATPNAPSGWSGDMDKFFDDLDSPKPPPEPAKTEVKPVEKPKEPDKKVATVKEPPVPAEKPDEGESPEPSAGKAGDFRRWGKQGWEMYKKSKEELKSLKTKVEELETLSANPTTPQAPPKEIEALTSQLEQAQKRLEEYELQTRMVRYEQSQEYRDKYLKPWQESISSAYNEIKELTVNITDPETGDVTERPATNADFDELVNMNLGAATKVAHEKFGHAAPYVLQMRKAIQDIARQAHAAVQEYRQKGADFEKQQSAAQIAKNQQLQQHWQKSVEFITTKAPDLFGPRDGDDEWNSEFAKGTALVNTKFGDEYLKLPEEQRVALDAKVYQFARAFLPMRAKLTKLESDYKAQLAEKDKIIADLQKSDPGKPAPSGSPAATQVGTWEEAMDKSLHD